MFVLQISSGMQQQSQDQHHNLSYLNNPESQQSQPFQQISEEFEANLSRREGEDLEINDFISKCLILRLDSTKQLQLDGKKI